MCAEKQSMGHSSLIGSVLSNRCPRCREGKLFTNNRPYDLRTTMRMPEHCPVCGQAFELQTGFYFGTGYVSYFLSVGFILFTAIVWFFTIGFSFNDNRLYWYLAAVTTFLLVTQPLNQRLCRSIWIAFFVRYDRNWREHIAATPLFS
jgi:uncharacterized protein (DUF983 family)